MTEEWKDIKNYDGIYQVSNLGNVKNKKYDRKLTGTKAKNGYITVMLSKNKIHKRKYVHRLVAETFIENKDNFKVVNHKNFNKADNRAVNLEWCSQKYNVMFSYLNGRMPLPPAQIPRKIKRNDGRIYNSIEDAAKEMKVNSGSICNQLKGRRENVNGYTFCYLS